MKTVQEDAFVPQASIIRTTFESVGIIMERTCGGKPLLAIAYRR